MIITRLIDDFIYLWGFVQRSFLRGHFRQVLICCFQFLSSIKKKEKKISAHVMMIVCRSLETVLQFQSMDGKDFDFFLLFFKVR